jgi:NAD(P)-dependent dehydrogenase (short-subunit alcohol dehydrogenase family)
VAPGLIGTEMALAIPDDVLEKMVASIPLDRMGTPDEIANVVWFLLTPLSSYITGEVIVVGGGRSLS